MMKKTLLTICAAAIICFADGQTARTVDPAVYTIYPDQVNAPIEPTMYGIFFEDINMAADGVFMLNW